MVGLACSVASVAQYETSYEFMMAQEAVAQGNNSEAYDLLTKELEKHPDNAAAHNWLGYLYLQAGQYEDAADVLEYDKLPEKAKTYRQGGLGVGASGQGGEGRAGCI